MLEKIGLNKGIRKIIAISLVITMTLANMLFLGKNLISYAFDENLENQGTSTQDSNVRFDAYFVDDGGDISHSVIFDATNDSNKINLSLSVKNAGYLKEAYVELKDEFFSKNTNYQIPNEIENSNLIENVNSNLKTIALNRIEAGTDAIIEIPVSLDITDIMDIDNLRKNTYVIFRGIYVNAQGNQVEISKTIKLNLGWTLNKDIILTQAISKFVPTEEGTLVQIKASVKQDTESFALPVKSTEIKVMVPEIAQTLPEKMSVVVNNTMATNGNKVEFTSENWYYDEEERTITISTDGYEDWSNVWSGVGTDEYFVTLIYPVDVRGIETVISCDMQAKMAVYTPNGIEEKTASSVGDVVLSEKYGDVVTYSLNANQDELSKGKIYANLNTDVKTYDTEYSAIIRANVSDYENIDELYINLNSDEFVNENNTYSTLFSNVGFTNYKQIKINKAKMQRLLGEDGVVDIYVDGEQYEFNKDSEEFDGDYILNIEASIVYVKTSKPISDGIFEVNVVKAISKDLPYSKDYIKTFGQLKINVTGEYRKVNSEDYISAETSDTIALKETSTKANLELSTTNLSSMVENKNVEIKIVLNNNVETSDLYNAPVFRIQMPEYIEDIEITGGNILYSNGLEFDYVERDIENKTITIHTKGAETAFSDGVFTNGTNIVLNTNIKVSMQAPNIEDKFVMTYTNDSAVSYENNATDEVAVNIIAPQEMVTYNSVLARGLQAVSKDGVEQAIKLDILDSSKIATMKMTILNKYSSACNNVRILGRTPFEGNTSIQEGKDLGTTFDAKMVSAIDTGDTNAVVYYSANENATVDLDDLTNGWTRDFASVSQIKSYLIVLEDYNMQPGESLEFSYNCQIPENLEHNESAFGTYVVYFDNASEYILSSVAEATRVGLTTGIGSNIEMSTKVIYNGNEITDADVVKENQTVTYRTTIKNTGSIDAENLNIHIDVENGEIKERGELKPLLAGQEIVYEYVVSVNEITSQNQVLKTKITATASNFEGELINEFENNVEASKLRLNIYTESSLQKVNENEFVVFINVVNTTNEKMNNIQISSILPNGIEYNDDKYTYDESSRTVSFSIDNLEANDQIYKTIELKTSIPSNIGKLETKTIFTARINNEEYMSNSLDINILAPVLSIDIAGSITNQSYIKQTNGLVITAVVKNTGEYTASENYTKIQLPDEFIVENVSCNIDGEEVTSIYKNGDNMITISGSLEKGQTLTARIEIQTTLYQQQDKEVFVSATTTARKYDTINSNTLSYTIEKVHTDDDDDDYPTDYTTPQTYKISGIAWFDENEDGQKQETEKLLGGIDILLIDANTGVIVTDSRNGIAKQTRTTSTGKYEFTNIPNGQYMVIFEYDTAKYDVTEYKKVGVADDLASKVIQTKINKDGTIKYAGVTDKFTITNSSVANLNIGLVEKEKFDLKLQKQIDMVTIENSSGTKTYTFDNPKLGKIDIQAKYLNSTMATIQYKLTVKNEGQVAGYAKKIVDYISNDLNFDVNQNPGWYIGTDGNLYNNELASVIIQPGESKEITLILTKKMTTENTGLITNSAEIYEDYNDLGYEDYNSKPGNKLQTENDFDSADLIITVRTGRAVLYISLAIVSTAIIATGAYMINKKVLKGGRR